MTEWVRTFKVGGQENLNVLRMQNVEGPGSDKEVLAEVVSGFIVLCNGAEKGKQPTIGV